MGDDGDNTQKVQPEKNLRYPDGEEPEDEESEPEAAAAETEGTPVVMPPNLPFILPKTKAPLFGKDDIITCTLDSDNESGILTFSVRNKNEKTGKYGDALELEFKNVFDLLGDEEIYPCVSICPYDDVEDDLEKK